MQSQEEEEHQFVIVLNFLALCKKTDWWDQMGCF
jgi:hypothetical protein